MPSSYEARACVGHHVGAQLDEAPERPVLDLDLLVEPAGRLGRAALAGDQQLAAADLERHVGDVDPGEVGLDHRARRVVGVEDVDRGREAAAAQAGLALEDVAEQLVDLAPHALEVGEQVTGRAHGDREYLRRVHELVTPLRADSGRLPACARFGSACSPCSCCSLPTAAAKDVDVQLLGLNDFHGHLESTTPGTIAPDPSSPRVPAGGAEYLATHIRAKAAENRNTLVVSAGDLIGASPLLSALFHDEPTIEAMNRIGLDLNAVGNHEFDEGAAELKRMQRGGCHPVDGCLDGTGFGGARLPLPGGERRATRTAARRSSRPTRSASSAASRSASSG